MDVGQEVECSRSDVACKESQWHHDPKVHGELGLCMRDYHREITFLGQYKCQFIFQLLYMIGIIVYCARAFESKLLKQSRESQR